MNVKTDTEHGKRGSDGQWHDAILGGDFTAKAGQMVTVTVSNYDSAPHSYTSPELGLNVTIPAGTEKVPHTMTFKFKAPSTAGSYEWFCALPCDPWAMSHDGYMRGHVTVTAIARPSCKAQGLGWPLSLSCQCLEQAEDLLAGFWTHALARPTAGPGPRVSPRRALCGA